MQIEVIIVILHYNRGMIVDLRYYKYLLFRIYYLTLYCYAFSRPMGRGLLTMSAPTEKYFIFSHTFVPFFFFFSFFSSSAGDHGTKSHAVFSSLPIILVVA